MAETPDIEQPARPEQTTLGVPRPIPRFALVLIGSLCTAVAVAILSKDWCSTTFLGLWISALTIWLLDKLVIHRLVVGRPWGRKAQIGAVIAVVGLFGALFHVSGAEAFRTAFGMSPPSGVRDLSVDCNFRLVDRILLLRFTADQATIDQVLAARPFRAIRETTEGYPQERNWNSLWQQLLGADQDHGGAGWQNVEPMKRPMHFQWENTWPQEVVDVLWDAESGRTYARYGTL